MAPHLHLNFNVTNKRKAYFSRYDFSIYIYIFLLKYIYIIGTIYNYFVVVIDVTIRTLNEVEWFLVYCIFNGSFAAH